MFFADRPTGSGTEEAALATLRSARALRGLSAVQVQRIESRLEGRARPKRPAFRLVVAVGLAVALCAGGTFAVAHIGLRRLPIVGPLFAAPRAPALASKIARTGPPRAESREDTSAPAGGPASTLAPARAIVPAIEEPASPLLAPSGSRAASPAGSAAGVRDRPQRLVDGPRKTTPRLPNETAQAENRAATDPLLMETQSFSVALGKWHRDHDGRAALELLDGHEHRFPAGQLKVEAVLLRAEILLDEGRDREALRLLDSVSLRDLPRARELQTVRGELRMKFGRCPEGRRDLEPVRAQDATDDFGRRATRAFRACP